MFYIPSILPLSSIVFNRVVEYTFPEPFEVNAIGLVTAWGSNGTWELPQDQGRSYS